MKHTHHIIPKHMGGSDDLSNLIELTIEEHAEAHRMLYEQHGKWQDKVAWQGLLGLIPHKEIMLEIYNANRGKGNAMYGKPCYYKMTEEQNQQWKDNISKGTIGRKDSEETKLKKSVANMGKHKGREPWNKGIQTGPQSAETRRKKGRPLIYRGTEYNSINEAQTLTGISSYKISQTCTFIE